MKNSYLVRNFNADKLFDYFFISAVASLLTIRFFLHLTHYPQLSGGNFHIAHMLWGGMLMLTVLLSLLFYLNSGVAAFAAIVGGVGFGGFIDELGKFITSNNNYLYEPAIAIIYAIFVILYLTFHFIRKRQSPNDKDYLINGIELVKEGIEGTLDRHELKLAVAYLKKGRGFDSRVADLLTEAVLNISTKNRVNNLLYRAKLIAKNLYWRLIKNGLFVNGLITFFIIKSVLSLFNSYFVFKIVIAHQLILTFSDWAEFLSRTAASLLVVIAIFMIRRSRLEAYRFLERSLYISIFLTQFFLFYHDQLKAVYGLTFNIGLLIIIKYLIYQETINQNNSLAT